MITITDKIYYVGVNDRNKSLFEGLWPLPNGVSYNAYLIVDEKVCLIDTVEVDFFMPFLKNIQEVLGERPIDYLVVNHMEPDHSGSIALIKKYYPDVKIVGNKKTFGMMSGFYGVSDGTVEVKNGDFIELGALKLNFVLTPMVHWPETMMTLCENQGATTRVLFSGDLWRAPGAGLPRPRPGRRAGRAGARSEPYQAPFSEVQYPAERRQGLQLLPHNRRRLSADMPFFQK